MFVTMTGIVPGLGAQVGVAVQDGHAKKFANLYCAEVAACAQADPILQGAAKAAGIGYTQLAVSSTAPSYTAQCLQLKQEGVDYAQLNFATAAAVRFVQNCQAQGYNPTWGIFRAEHRSRVRLAPELHRLRPGVRFPLGRQRSPGRTVHVRDAEVRDQQQLAEGTASFTWQGLQAFAQAVKNADVAASTAVTSADVMTGLYDFKGENLGGLLANNVTYTKGKPFGFTANACYFVVGMKGGQTTAPAELTPQCPAKA